MTDSNKYSETLEELLNDLNQTNNNYDLVIVDSNLEFYNFENIMILGSVTSGKGGELILTHAKKVLEFEFPSIEKNLSFTVPIDSERRNGQARAAASLPEIE